MLLHVEILLFVDRHKIIFLKIQMYLKSKTNFKELRAWIHVISCIVLVLRSLIISLLSGFLLVKM